MKETVPSTLFTRVILLGPPGCGKTSLANKFEEKYEYQIISTGELLRQQLAESTTRLAKTIRQHMEEKTLLPDEIIIEMIRDAIEKCQREKKKWILDGFPRTEKQANALRNENILPEIIIELQLSQEICRKRILERRIDMSNNRIYSLSNMPSENEIKSRLKQRTDDNYDNFKSRYQAYGMYGQNVLNVYDNIVKIQANKNEEDLFSEVCKYLTIPAKDKKFENARTHENQKPAVRSISTDVKLDENKAEKPKETQPALEMEIESKSIKDRKDQEKEDAKACKKWEDEETKGKDRSECDMETQRLTNVTNRDSEMTKTNESSHDENIKTSNTSRLLLGVDIIKHGRRGAPHTRTIFCDEKFDRIYWQKKASKLKCKNDQSIKLKDVELARGICTEILQRSGEILKRNLYLSIISDDRSLDMECANEEEADELYNNLNDIIKRKNNQA